MQRLLWQIVAGTLGYASDWLMATTEIVLAPAVITTREEVQQRPSR